MKHITLSFENISKNRAYDVFWWILPKLQYKTYLQILPKIQNFKNDTVQNAIASPETNAFCIYIYPYRYIYILYISIRNFSFSRRQS